MRLTILLTIILSINQGFCQSVDLKKIVLNQIDSMIYNSPRLLGKTFYQFYSMGRQKGFSDELFDWEMTVIDPETKGEYEKMVMMRWEAQTFIAFNSKTHLSYAIDVNPNVWVSTDELHTHLKNTYGLDERGFSYLIKVSDNKTAFFRFDIRKNIPWLTIFNAGPDGKALYFK